jgi:hypothetical protein
MSDRKKPWRVRVLPMPKKLTTEWGEKLQDVLNGTEDAGYAPSFVVTATGVMVIGKLRQPMEGPMLLPISMPNEPRDPRQQVMESLKNDESRWIIAGAITFAKDTDKPPQEAVAEFIQRYGMKFPKVLGPIIEDIKNMLAIHKEHTTEEEGCLVSAALEQLVQQLENLHTSTTN